MGCHHDHGKRQTVLSRRLPQTTTPCYKIVRNNGGSCLKKVYIRVVIVVWVEVVEWVVVYEGLFLSDT